uniref:PH domain-containing protein n=1 Tax=Salarias fasciatus TaxID=181472 RepID=A0A672JU43_SALFA
HVSILQSSLIEPIGDSLLWRSRRINMCILMRVCLMWVQESDGKVQTFGKRCHAAKRDPNCPVVIRGWLNKKDSSGLKLWKRRWFVLSNYCLFYYKDSREESVLGSIPLPSYKILFCTPRECKNRKFTFKVVHQGMRSYFFSADTQEDMLGWVRALSQSAAMEIDSSLNRFDCIHT